MHAFPFPKQPATRPHGAKLACFIAFLCCALSCLQAGAQTVRFLTEDRTTKGNWKGVYGKEGNYIGSYSTSPPSYGAVAVTGADYSDAWKPGSDVRGLQQTSDRVAPLWSKAATFDVNFTVTDGNKHVISIYCLDWDNKGRSQNIEVRSAATDALLDTRSLSAFQNGAYLKWEVTGSVRLKVTKTGTGNYDAAISAVFLDGVSTARWVSDDLVTKGNWKGVYGKEGYYIGNDLSDVPDYGTLTVTDRDYSTWNPGTDVRGLQEPVGTGRVAPYWYKSSSFNMTFNATSNDKPHVLSFYCLDWGTVVRAQKIELFDLMTNDLLASCDLTNYEGGTYARFEVKGGVKVKITNAAGSTNAVVSAVFFDQVSSAAFAGEDRTTKGDWKGLYGSEGHYIGSHSTSAPAYGTLAMTGTAYATWTPGSDVRGLQEVSGTGRVAPHWYTGTSFEMNFDAGDADEFRLLSLYCLDWDNIGRAQKIEVFSRVTGEPLASCDLTGFQGGTYARFYVKGGVRVKVTKTSGANAVVSAVFFDPQPTVRFAGEDRNTQGDWKRVYGKSGRLIGTTSSAPSFGSVEVTGQTNESWVSGDDDVRGLQDPDDVEDQDEKRVAPYWKATTSFQIDFTAKDRNKHIISLYCLAWDAPTHSQKIEVINPATNAVLDTRTVSSFDGGAYIRWEVTGSVRFKVTGQGSDPKVSAVFFDQATGAARFAGEDRITKGDWKGAYGKDGNFIGSYSESAPSYASAVRLTPGRAMADWTTGDDLRGLQNPEPPGIGRVAPHWYAGGSFDVIFNATDTTTPHLLSVYCLDWDNLGRSQKIEVFDLVTNDLLDSRGVTDFSNGAYFRWEVKGGVRLRVSNAGGSNAVVSGFFFDPIALSRTAHRNLYEVPYFRSEPLPPEYLSKSVEELTKASTNNTVIPSSAGTDPLFDWAPRPFGRSGAVTLNQERIFARAGIIDKTLRVKNDSAASVTIRVDVSSSNNGPWTSKYTVSTGANSSSDQEVSSITENYVRLIAPAAASNVTVSLLRSYAASAPEFKPHTALNQFVEDMNADPMALAAFVQNEIALVDAIKPGDREDDLSGPHLSSDALVPAEMRRNAYTTYIDRQGSPYEQCNLLVYLLRQAGYRTAMVDPAGWGVKMLGKRLSNMLHLQMKGFLTAGDDDLVEVQYPWVVFYDTSTATWRHLFPWIKDTVVEEGFDLYPLLPESHNTGRKWMEAYLKNDPQINEFLGGDGEDTPSLLFNRFVEKHIAADGLSLKDVGMRIYDRKNIYSAWRDFPVPFKVGKETPAALNLKADWKASPDLYSYARIILVDPQQREFVTTNRRHFPPATPELTEWQYAMALNGRSISTYFTTGYDHPHTLAWIWLQVGPFDPTLPVTTTGNRANNYNDVEFPDLNRDGGRLEYVRRFKSSAGYSSMSPGNQDSSSLNIRDLTSQTVKIQWVNSQVTDAEHGPIVPISERRIDMGEIGGINLKFGGVTAAGIDLLRTQSEQLDDEPRLGAITHLAGQAYFDRVDRLGGALQSMHKSQADIFGLGVSVLKGTSTPRIDMPMYTFPYWNNSLRPDQAASRQAVMENLSNLLALELSAQEHAVINDFYHQKDAISTVKLLRIANKTKEIVRPGEALAAGPDTDANLKYPDGFYKMTSEEFKASHSASQIVFDAALPSDAAGEKISDLMGVFTPYDKGTDYGYTGTSPNKVPLKNKPAFSSVWNGGPTAEDFVAAYSSNATASRIVGNFKVDDSWGKLNQWCVDNPEGTVYITPGPVKGEDSVLQPTYVGWGSLMVGKQGNLAGWIQGNQAIYNGGFGVNFSPAYASTLSGNLSSLSVGFSGSSYFLSSPAISSMNSINPSWAGLSVWTMPMTLPMGAPTSAPFLGAYSQGFGQSGFGWASVADDGFLGDAQFHRGWETSPNFVQDPVNAVNGEFYVDEVDLTLPGPLSLELRRNYSSQSEANSILGPGWKLSLMPFLSVAGKNSGDEGYVLADHEGKYKGHLIYAADLDGSVLAFRDQGFTRTNVSWTNGVNYITLQLADDLTGVAVGQWVKGTGIAENSYITSINTGNRRLTLNKNTTAPGTNAKIQLLSGAGPWKVDAEDNPGLKNFNGKENEEIRNPFNETIVKTVESSIPTYTWYKADGSKAIYKVGEYPIIVKQKNNSNKPYDREMPYIDTFADSAGNSFKFTFYTQNNSSPGNPVELSKAEVGYGQLKKIQSSNGNFLIFSYDSQQRITEAYTNDGRRVKYRYDPLGDLVQVELPDAAVYNYEYQHELAPRPYERVEANETGLEWFHDGIDENSGTRIKGWLQPPINGAYKFRLSGGGDKKVLMSGNATDPSDATSVPLNIIMTDTGTVTVNLLANGGTPQKGYYLETRQADAGSIRLEWQKPGETTWATINKADLRAYLPDDPTDNEVKKIMVEVYENVNSSYLADLESMTKFKGLPYSRNLMTKVTDPEGRVTLNEYDKKFVPDHPKFGEYKYRRVVKQWSSAGPDMVPILTAEFQYNPVGNPWLAAGDEVSLMIDKTRPTPDIGDQVTTYVHKKGCLKYVAQPLAAGFSTTNTDIPYVAAYEWEEIPDGSRKVRRLLQSRDLRKLKTLLAYDDVGGVPGLLRSVTTQGDLTGEGGVNNAVTTYFHNADKRVIKTILPSPAGGSDVRTQVIFATYPSITEPIREADGSTGRTDDYLYRHRPVKITRYAVADPLRDTAAEPLSGDKVEETLTTYVEKVDTNGSFARALTGVTVKNQYAGAAAQEKEHITIAYGAKGYPQTKTIKTYTGDPVTESYVYDARGLMIANEGPAKRVKRQSYDPRGRPTLEEDYTSAAASKPSVWEYSYYNQMGELIWKDGPRYDPEDYQFFDYDGAGRKIVEVMWNSRANSANNGVEANGYSIVNHFYDGSGNRIKTIDPRGNYSLMTYDAAGRMVSTKSYDAASPSTPLSEESFHYEPGGEVDNHVDPLTGVTTTTYTDDGKPMLVTKPDGSTEKWTYYVDGRIKTHEIAGGAVWTHTYNDLTLTETRELKSAGTTPFLIAKAIVTADIRGKVVSEENFTGDILNPSYVSETAYDGLGRVILETGPPTVSGRSERQQKAYAYTYDDNAHTDTVTMTEGGGSRKTIVTTDNLGREASTEVQGPGGVVLESSLKTYDKTNHFVTLTKGTHSVVKAEQQTYTDIAGRPVLVRHKDGGSSWQTTVIRYDVSGNAVSATDEESNTTTNKYDALNRLVWKKYPDDAVVEFTYNPAGAITGRKMPGGLNWYAAYNTAGQLEHEYIQQGTGPISRYSGYTYYTAAGSHKEWVGLVDTISERAESLTPGVIGVKIRQHTFGYDDQRRSSSRVSSGGTDLTVNLTTTYDFLGQVTSATRISGGVETKVESAYDGYGQLYKETVYLGSVVQSQVTQRWDSLGMRSGLTAGSAAPALPGGSSFGKDFGFSYYGNGKLKEISTQAGRYRTAYTYADNGLVTDASLYDGTQLLKNISTPLSEGYDSRGRSREKKTSAAGGQILKETVQRRGDSRVEDYEIERGSGAGGSWANAMEERAYDYDARGKLISESYLTNPNAPTSGRVPETLNYGYDTDKLGVLTSVSKASGGAIWGATKGDFARANLQSSNPALRTFEVKGTAHGPGRFSLYAKPFNQPDTGYVKQADFQPTPRASSTPGTPNADWSYPVSLPPGEYMLEARARMTDHPARPYEAKHSTKVVVEDGPIQYALTHDSSGRVISRAWGGAGTDFVQDIKWSADDRITRVTLTDKRPGGTTIYVWDAVYDPQGRRIQTSWLPSGDGSQARVTNSLFDPEIEFLEIAVEYGGKRQWKIHGPDVSGEYGGAEGIGGCEAVIDEKSAAIAPVINDFFGHTVAHVDTAGTATTADDQVIWHQVQMSGYGVLPGFTAPGIEHTGDLLSAMNWQGRRLDPTGFYNMGARYYDPEGRKFLSPDPLGHGASMDLYNYANGDPINFIDPDGRLARMTSGMFEFQGDPSISAALMEMGDFVGGNIMDFVSGRGFSFNPSMEGVAEWHTMLKVVQVAAIPLSFLGGPIGLFSMGVSTAASLAQGDVAGAALGAVGVFGGMKGAALALRAETGVASSFYGGGMFRGAAAEGAVGRGFNGTASQPWGPSKSLGTASSGGSGMTLNYKFTLSNPAKTGGRHGNEATRAHVDQIATEMERRGFKITGGGNRLPEEYLPGPGGGRKGSSYPDITATKDGRTVRVNTVDTRADGVTPSTREATNAKRIRSQTPGDHLLLVPKPKKVASE